MKESQKIFTGLLTIIIGIMSVLSTIASLIAIKFSGLTFFALFILEITTIIDIGRNVIWYPLGMLVGGLIVLFLSWFITFICAFVLSRL